MNSQKKYTTSILKTINNFKHWENTYQKYTKISFQAMFTGYYTNMPFPIIVLNSCIREFSTEKMFFVVETLKSFLICNLLNSWHLIVCN